MFPHGNLQLVECCREEARPRAADRPDSANMRRKPAHYPRRISQHLLRQGSGNERGFMAIGGEYCQVVRLAAEQEHTMVF